VKQPDIVVCIEHVAREFHLACAIRYLARARYGLAVQVLSLSQDLEAALANLRPHVVTVPFCRSRQDFGIETILERCPQARLVNLACEQLLNRGSRVFRLPADSLARREVTHVAAGDFFRQWLLQARVPPENVVTAGSLTCEMYRRPYRTLFESRRDELARMHGLDSNRPWVFFPENFSAAFMSAAHRRFRQRRGFRARDLRAYIAYSQATFRQVAPWCVAAASLGTVELIVRPRPAIDADVFARNLQDAAGSLPRERLHLIKSGNVREWIHASQLVVSNYSSTLVEAAVAGKPAFLLSPVDLPESALMDWYCWAERLSDREAFLQVLLQADDVRPPTRLAQWADRNLLPHGDAIANVTALLADICQGRRMAPCPTGQPRWSRATQRFRKHLRRGERQLRDLLLPGRKSCFVHSSDRISPQAVEACTRQWEQILGPDHRRVSA